MPKFKNIINSIDLIKKTQLKLEFNQYFECAKNENTSFTNNADIAIYWKNKIKCWPFSSKIVYNYLFVPISSAEVERSFSCYNNILNDNRHNLSEENLKFLNALYYNSM
jgi:hypothetical protein